MSLFGPALGVLGFVLIILSVLMVFPGIIAAMHASPNFIAFSISALVALSMGLLLLVLFRKQIISPNPRKMFLITSGCWIGGSLFSALPLYLSDLSLSLTDAVFEAVSGITTTGSTVLTGLDSMGQEILLWRSITQWVGGLGVIGMSVAILPFLQTGAMRLFRTESSDWSPKTVARDKSQLRYILSIYLLLTLLCTVAYFFGGMTWFEAANHAMTTISTGGYSTSDASIGHFPSLMIQWSSVIFMLMGGLPFVLYIQLVIGGKKNAVWDEQVRAYFGILVLAGLTLTLYLMLARDAGFGDALTKAFVNTTSVLTTTGYASEDYGGWGTGAVTMFLFLMFLGGCSGSTSGGIKIFRIQLLMLFLREQLLISVHPRAITVLKYNRQPVDTEVIASFVAFLGMATATVVVLTVGLGITGLDLITSASAAITAVMNVGPGLGDVIGPAGNFQELSSTAKWLLCGGMIAGRLEFLALFVLMAPAFWKG